MFNRIAFVRCHKKGNNSYQPSAGIDTREKNNEVKVRVNSSKEWRHLKKNRQYFATHYTKFPPTKKNDNSYEKKRKKNTSQSMLPTHNKVENIPPHLTLTNQQKNSQ